MKKILLKFVKNRSRTICPIFIGTGLIGHINNLIPLKDYSSAVIVTDENIPAVFIDTLKDLPIRNGVIRIPAGELNKSLDNVQKIWFKLHKIGCDRKSLIINIGGGIVGDVGGFAASTYMRGIDFMQIPTTLIAQADAGIGGKNGINFDGVKNLIGLIRQPIGVVMDIDTLKTLPPREFVSGFGEIIKHGLIGDPKLYRFAVSKKPVEFTKKELVWLVERSCELKAAIVSHDETEKGMRKLLNFGHTLGHALEALSLRSRHPLNHGEAVCLGMITESYISYRMGLLALKEFNDIERKIKSLDLFRPIDNISDLDVLRVIKSDKKSKQGIVRWTLLTKIGKGKINITVPDIIVSESLQYLRKTSL